MLIVESDLEVEVYQYDGKSFIPNDIQFTDGSFGRGVASLRVFNLNGEDLIGIVLFFSVLENPKSQSNLILIPYSCCQ